MQVGFGILLIITGAASGLLFQDPVVCRFTESNQCYVALRQQLHLQMPLEDRLDLKYTDKTLLLKYRKTQSDTQTQNIPGWQFVNDNKTLILTSAERNNSGTYRLETRDADGKSKGDYTLQLNIEVQVSSVKVSYSCSSPDVMTVSCSADGDNLHFNWASDLNTLPQLENRTSTLILNKDHHGNVTCSVENHVSRDHITTELQSCPAPTTPSSGISTPTSHGTNYMNSTVNNTMTYRNSSTTSTLMPSINSIKLYLILISLGSVFVLLIMISILAFYMYKKRQGQKNKEAPSQEGRELVYAQVAHLPMDRIETRPGMSHDEDVEYAEVVTRATKRKQKKKEDEVQYGELVFNTPARNKNKVAKVQDDCVYAHVQHNQ